MRWYRNIKFLYNMKKVTIVFDFESQSMDVSVNDARECVTPATTVEEMYAKEVFAIRCFRPRQAVLPAEVYGSGNAVRESLLTFVGHNIKLTGDGKD